MKILITGASGFVGTCLIEKLIDSGHQDIRILTRNIEKFEKECSLPVDVFYWNPKDHYIEVGALENVDYVIHLAGEGVADGRWNEDKKGRILSSRVEGTKLLMDEIKKGVTTPRKFISASAIGIYGDRGEEVLDSKSTLGTGFLAEVCKQWESICLNNEIKDMQGICIRTGIVLGRNGGALNKMLPAFKMGVAGKLGAGNQYMSWIHIDDLVGQFIWLLNKESDTSIYNGVSPHPMTNLNFTKILGKVLKRPTLFPVPTFGLKLLLGEMSEILLNGQKVVPTNFINEGFQFQYPNLEDALKEILKYTLKGEIVLTKYQMVNKGTKEVFNFFSNEKNLEKLTPNNLDFKVLRKSTINLEEGTLIDYDLKIHGFPIKWQSKITKFKAEEGFVDEQIKGPYSKWVHTHDFISVKNGTIIKDKIVYKVPFGKIGLLVTGFIIKNDLKNIFNFRRRIINQQFS